MAWRTDAHDIRKVTATPQGGIRVEAALTRSGIFVYRNPDGTLRREYRPPDEVFRADALADLCGAPVTNLHPPDVFVTAKNWRRRAVGHVAENVRQDGDLVLADLLIQDADMIAAVSDGSRRAVSLGYRCDYDPTPGVTPDGQAYDGVQRRVCYNHVALVPKGRGGPEMVIRLDADGNEIQAMTPEEIEALKVRLDAAEAEVKSLKDAAAGEPARVQAAVSARMDLVQKATKVGVAVRADASDEAVKAAVIAKAFPNLSLEGKNAAYVDGIFDAALNVTVLAAPTEAPKGNAAQVRADSVDARKARLDAIRADADADEPPDVKARRDMNTRAAKASLKD